MAGYASSSSVLVGDDLRLWSLKAQYSQQWVGLVHLASPACCQAWGETQLRASRVSVSGRAGSSQVSWGWCLLRPGSRRVHGCSRAGRGLAVPQSTYHGCVVGTCSFTWATELTLLWFSPCQMMVKSSGAEICYRYTEIHCCNFRAFDKWNTCLLLGLFSAWKESCFLPIPPLKS